MEVEKLYLKDPSSSAANQVVMERNGSNENTAINKENSTEHPDKEQ